MTGIGLLGLLALVLVLALDVVAMVDIIRRPMDPAMKILWVILIVALPVIGLILYYVLGRK